MTNLTTQRETIIKKLQDAGERGVTSYAFTYDYQIKQCPTRIFELKKLGFNIISKPYKNSVRYILLNTPKDAPEAIVAPQKGIADVIREIKANQYKKIWPDGHVTWEDRKPNEQQSML